MKKRYIGAFEDILNRHYVSKDVESQVLVMVSHHKAIDYLNEYAAARNPKFVKASSNSAGYCYCMKYERRSAL